MNAEEKQALIEHCEVILDAHPEETTLYIMAKMALAALTAQPVKLPKSERVANGYYFDMNDVFVALESAGVKFEVQE